MRTLVVAAVVAVSACGPRPASSPTTDDAAVRLAIARAELRRGDGVTELIALADHADADVRATALRGLGRVGDAAAIEALRARVVARKDDVAAAAAIGIAGALGTIPEADAPAITQELIALLGQQRDPIVVDALGRAGDASALPTLTALIASDDDALAAAAGIALGRFGRRAIALDDAAIAAAIARVSAPAKAVRYAAVYALSRGHVAPAEGAVAPRAAEAAAALATAVDDQDPEVRALALLGIAKRGVRAAAGDRVIARLADDDWRVAVEAVRVLTAAGAPDADLQAVAVAAARTWTRVANGERTPAHGHVVIEAVRALLPHAGKPAVKAVDGLASSVGFDKTPPKLERLIEMVWALHRAALARTATTDDARRQAMSDLRASGRELDVWTDTLFAETATALVEQGHVAIGFDAVLGSSALVNHAAPALAAMGPMWSKLDADQRALVVELIAGRLLDERAAVSGTAAELLTTILPTLVGDEPAVARFRDRLELALIDAATRATDPELVSTILAAIGTTKVAGGLPVCRDALAHGNAVVRGAARDCVIALGEPDPGVPPAAALTMPAGVDPAPLLARGARVTWILDTTYGEVRIALDPRRAPWTVASLVALSQREFYAANVFHRVVPDFVVQGGDPDGTGWGGPGYTLPAEPSLAPYATGAIGIADAGKDTGGSQWFAMHGPAPHLDARYTQVGEVVAGADVIDLLQVGDIAALRVEVQ